MEWSKPNDRRIDPEMVNLIKALKTSDYTTLGCCCGHGKYRQTIVVRDNEGIIFELNSLKRIPRKKRFYVKDKDGYYYIPEVEDAHT